MEQSTIDEIRNWQAVKRCNLVVSELQKRGFEATFCTCLDDAKKIIFAHSETAQTVGFGGSLSVALMNLTSPLKEKGKTILNHGFPSLTDEEKFEIMRKQQTCDLFLTGTNALTLDGILVNIDGNGNRINAMTFGPKQVVVVAGKNKIVAGSPEDAVKFIKDRSAPMNAYRLNRKTPCAATGVCVNCQSPECICRITSIMTRCPTKTKIHVLVVNEELGL